MKTKILLTAVVAAALCGGAAVAQNAEQAPGTPTPTQVVYLPQLPTVAGLTASAAAENVAVVRADQTDGRIVVVYKYPNGATTTVAYEVMPAGADAPPPPAAAAPAAAAAAPGRTTVIYQGEPAYYYPDYYPYWGWYPPVAVGIGFGWGWGWGGGFHGGWHGGFRR